MPNGVATSRKPMTGRARGAARVGIGAAAGAVAGLVVAGPALRLFMFVVRQTSPPSTMGLESDDGFVIGRFSGATLGFVVSVAVIAAVVGAVYASVRLALPARVAAPLFTAAVVAAGSAGLIHSDGIDFVLLGPLAVTTGGLVLAGLVGCIAIVLAVELATRRVAARVGAAAGTGSMARVAAALAMAIMAAVAVTGTIRAIGTIADLVELRRALG